MSICHAPRTKAGKNRPKATQQLYRVRRLLLYTARPFRGAQAGEPSFAHDIDVRPHSVMTDTAKLVARHPVVARRIEARADLGDEARDHHRVHVGPDEQEPMNHIGACQAELDRCVGWHPHAFWDKIILLGDPANGDRTVGFDRRAKIAFGEFAAEMQSYRIDNLYVARRME